MYCNLFAILIGAVLVGDGEGEHDYFAIPAFDL